MKDTLTLMKIVFITAPSNPIRSRHKRCARRRPARTHVAAIFSLVFKPASWPGIPKTPASWPLVSQSQLVGPSNLHKASLLAVNIQPK